MVGDGATNLRREQAVQGAGARCKFRQPSRNNLARAVDEWIVVDTLEREAREYHITRYAVQASSTRTAD